MARVIPALRPKSWIPDESMLSFLLHEEEEATMPDFNRAVLLYSQTQYEPCESAASIAVPNWAPLYVPQKGKGGVIYGRFFGGRSRGTLSDEAENDASRFCIDLRNTTPVIYNSHRSSSGIIDLMRVSVRSTGDLSILSAVFQETNFDVALMTLGCIERRLCNFCAMRGSVCSCTEDMRLRALPRFEDMSQACGLACQTSSDLNDLWGNALADFCASVFNSKFYCQGKLNIGLEHQIAIGAPLNLPIQAPKNYSFTTDGNILDSMRERYVQSFIVDNVPLLPQVPALVDDMTSEWVLDEQNISSHSSDKTPHNPDEPTCTICGATFKRKYEMQRHVKTVHLRERNFECTVCGQKFIHKSHLRVHVSSVHHRVCEAQCPECGKPFATQAKVNRHILSVHRKQRNIVCEICGKKFFQRSDLKKHEQNHSPAPNTSSNSDVEHSKVLSR